MCNPGFSAPMRLSNFKEPSRELRAIVPQLGLPWKLHFTLLYVVQHLLTGSPNRINIYDPAILNLGLHADGDRECG